MRNLELGLNIEIKARYDDLDLFKSKLVQLPVSFEGEDYQTDTFYIVPQGRLKLRESNLYGSILIPYIRSDEKGTKQSDYDLLPVSDPQKTKNLLSNILGVRGEVKKRRLIYIFENVRIHLDEVESLGNFIEFEAVIDDMKQIESNNQKVQWLLEYFNIDADHLLRVAYIDLISK
ncbi:MAG: class IV adenylate cyclase [Calditrichaceae bacterium]